MRATIDISPHLPAGPYDEAMEKPAADFEDEVSRPRIGDRLKRTEMDSRGRLHQFGGIARHDGTTTPRHSPKPMETYPALRATAIRQTSSPSSRNVRLSPLGSATTAVPPSLISSRLP